MKKEIFFEEVFDAQEQFRIVLDAMAHPGIIYNLKDFDFEAPLYLSNASAVIAFALLNADASFHATGDSNINQYLAINTGAVHETIENSDFVFINGSENAEVLFKLKHGNLSYPEDAATVLIDVENMSNSYFENSIEIIFRGPGVEFENRVFVRGLNIEILQTVKEINFEFPLGIDLIFCNKNNQIVGLPRSNNFDFKI
jgi:alpha-D-ribose 1-methylphosphonate 5-triphosphate synthase subunit PhnH